MGGREVTATSLSAAQRKVPQEDEEADGRQDCKMGRLRGGKGGGARKVTGAAAGSGATGQESLLSRGGRRGED